MIEVELAPRFKKDLKHASNHPEYDRQDLLHLLEDFTKYDPLPTHYNEHSLGKRSVNWAGFKECHLGDDLVVIFVRFKGVVRLHRIGGHAELFKPRTRQR